MRGVNLCAFHEFYTGALEGGFKFKAYKIYLAIHRRSELTFAPIYTIVAVIVNGSLLLSLRYKYRLEI